MSQVRSPSSAVRFAKKNVGQWKRKKEREERRRAFLAKVEHCGGQDSRGNGQKPEIEFRRVLLQGDLERVRGMMLNGSYDIAEREGDWNALAAACSNGHYEIARFLLEAGADPDRVDSFGKTPLMCAAIYGFAGIVNLLFEHGADLEAHDRKGRTAKELAEMQKRDETVSLLHELEKR
jgi:ankyrin repeat protein